MATNKENERKLKVLEIELLENQNVQN